MNHKENRGLHRTATQWSKLMEKKDECDEILTNLSRLNRETTVNWKPKFLFFFHSVLTGPLFICLQFFVLFCFFHLKSNNIESPDISSKVTLVIWSIKSIKQTNPVFSKLMMLPPLCQIVSYSAFVVSSAKSCSLCFNPWRYKLLLLFSFDWIFEFWTFIFYAPLIKISCQE